MKNSIFRPHAVLITAIVCYATTGSSQTRPDLVLRGSMTHNDNQTYKLLPFTVPAGVKRITIEFTHTGRDQKTVVNLGVLAPNGFRGWSGGRLGTFTMSEIDASPSYLPGTILPGTWQLLLGIPNIRAGVTAEYAASIYFSRSGQVASAPAGIYPVLNHAQRWYRGDLHMHTGNSDGSCKSQTGATVPCPLFFTVQSAAKRPLDFIAITDHNTTSQYAEMRQLQLYFDRVLLIPGCELTTFQGHANIFGTTDFVDFRVGTQGVPTWNVLLESAHASGALVSINHPNSYTGEDCLGCGWHPDPPADIRLVEAVEAINGLNAEGPYAGTPFWEAQLNRGYRITGIAASDNHNATAPLPEPGSIGYPSTVVYARELSIPAILEAIRAGHVFIDTAGSPDRLLEMSGHLGATRAMMGDALDLPSAAVARFDVHVAGATGGRVELIQDGKQSPLLPGGRISSDEESISFQWQSDGQRHWFRANVRDDSSKLLLVGNPIYVNFGSVASGAKVQSLTAPSGAAVTVPFLSISHEVTLIRSFKDQLERTGAGKAESRPADWFNSKRGI